MSLPILKVSSAPTAETLVRYLHQTESDWTSHMAEKTSLDFGTAWANPQLGRVFDANRILDVALPEAMSADAAFSQVEAHYSALGVGCAHWVMNPSAPEAQTASMTEYLLARGYGRCIDDIMYLQHLPSAIGGAAPQLRIIPARASFRHCQSLHDEFAKEVGEPQVALAGMSHLDDPHYDALVALNDGQAVAHIGVLASGEVGRVDQLFVSKAFRRQHIGTTMMARAMEICARSLFKHVLLLVSTEYTPAIRLYEKFGFSKIGQMVSYAAPGVLRY